MNAQKPLFCGTQTIRLQITGLALNLHVHSDYAPPRSWEQFEELCADVFQSAWGDPTLVRHGRAGQRQHGVDIVARNGAIYPIGLQCKKRSRWPVKKVTSKQIDDEISEALNFTPKLKAFYILTTAPDDSGLQKHIRKINQRHEQERLFEVVLLGWNEIVRRATLDPTVADKHFAPAGGGAPRSPLLATWFMSDSKLEITTDELSMCVEELVQDLLDHPNGHFVIRQRESDQILQELRKYEGRTLSTSQRRKRIALRKELRVLTDAEKRAVRAIRMMITDPEISGWLLKVWEPYGDLPLTIEAFINDHTGLLVGNHSTHTSYLRMSPSGDPERRCATPLNAADLSAIWDIMETRRNRFGSPLTDTVSELPDDIRARKATPRIIREVLNFLDIDRLSWDEIRTMKALEIGSWKVSIA